MLSLSRAPYTPNDADDKDGGGGFGGGGGGDDDDDDDDGIERWAVKASMKRHSTRSLLTSTHIVELASHRCFAPW